MCSCPGMCIKVLSLSLQVLSCIAYGFRMNKVQYSLSKNRWKKSMGSLSVMSGTTPGVPVKTGGCSITVFESNYIICIMNITLEVVVVELVAPAEVQDWVRLPPDSGEPLASCPCMGERERLILFYIYIFCFL